VKWIRSSLQRSLPPLFQEKRGGNAKISYEKKEPAAMSINAGAMRIKEKELLAL